MLKAYCHVSILDKNKKIIRKGRKWLSRSFLKGFIVLLARQLATSVSYAATDIDGVSRSASVASLPFWCNVGGGFGLGDAGTISCDTVGIVVGTGTTAVTPADNKLESRIVHGVTTNTLEYFGTLNSDVTVSAPNASFTAERIFRNSSGGSIDVKESGLYMLHGNSPRYSYCVIRDVLVSPITVTDGQYMKVTYTFQITA